LKEEIRKDYDLFSKANGGQTDQERLNQWIDYASKNTSRLAFSL
jgi:hypothetical protein